MNAPNINEITPEHLGNSGCMLTRDKGTLDFACATTVVLVKGRVCLGRVMQVFIFDPKNGGFYFPQIHLN